MSLDLINVQDPMELLKNDPEANAILRRIIIESNFRAVSALGFITNIEEIIRMIDSEIAE